ncbi:Imm1 family immunity protein [Burkholderia sp. LMG 32019]|uniref:Imm1 family immunity protein n=1 Tax=Burkholderia sp. LMG 32019 TaxID=3158173 RepID=UPI003C2D5B3C
MGTPEDVTDEAGEVAWSSRYKAWGEAKEVISEAARKTGIRSYRKCTHRPSERHMQVVKIIEEKYVGNRSEVVEQDYVEAAQVISAIERMNDRDPSSVMFLMNDETAFSVGGGEGDRYVAFLAIGTDEALFALVASDKPEDEYADLVVGGQRGSYSLRQCVDKATVIQAALYFCQFGQSDPRLVWQDG